MKVPDAFGNDPVCFGYDNGAARKSMKAGQLYVRILSFLLHIYIYIRHFLK